MSRTITITLYSFAELSDDVKEKVLNEHRRDFDDINVPNIYRSVNAIADACDMELTETYGLYPRFKFGLDTIDLLHLIAMDNRRMLAYIWNNYIEPNLTGKFYYKKGKNYHSKATKVFSCPFTGYYADDILYLAWKELCSRAKAGEEICVCDFADILTAFARKEIEADDEWVTSDEFLEEMFEANDYEFLADGTLYKG